VIWRPCKPTRRPIPGVARGRSPCSRQPAAVFGAANWPACSTAAVDRLANAVCCQVCVEPRFYRCAGACIDEEAIPARSRPIATGTSSLNHRVRTGLGAGSHIWCAGRFRAGLYASANWARCLAIANAWAARLAADFHRRKARNALLTAGGGRACNVRRFVHGMAGVEKKTPKRKIPRLSPPRGRLSL